MLRGVRIQLKNRSQLQRYAMSRDGLNLPSLRRSDLPFRRLAGSGTASSSASFSVLLLLSLSRWLRVAVALVFLFPVPLTLVLVSSSETGCELLGFEAEDAGVPVRCRFVACLLLLETVSCQALERTKTSVFRMDIHFIITAGSLGSPVTSIS